MAFLAYWLNVLAFPDDIAAIHSVVAFSSPLRGAGLGQLDLCAFGIVLSDLILQDSVIEDLCASLRPIGSAADELVLPHTRRHSCY